MFSFETLKVYDKAFELNQVVYDLLKENTSLPHYIKNQFGRASLSIMLNIAEGSAKFSKKDRRNFYITARGSAFECVSLLCFLHEQREINAEIKGSLYSTYEEIARILYVMIKNLGT